MILSNNHISTDFIKVMILSLFFALLIAASHSAVAITHSTGHESASMPNMVPAIERSISSVVSIKLKKSPCTIHDIRSGVIIDAKEGYIVTNSNRIDSQSHMVVELLDGRSFEAKVTGIDKATGIAVIQIKADNLTEIIFENSDDVKVGDYVLAIGHPHQLTHTVTSGIVSAKGRHSHIRHFQYESYLQTDAPINIGNAGGALVNYRGHFIAMNSSIISTSGGNAGLGFAMPSNMVSKIATHLIKDGKVNRGVIGIRVANVQVSGLPSQPSSTPIKGVIISKVGKDGPVSKAHLKETDVILKVSGKQVHDVREFELELAMHIVGDTLEIDYLRNGKEMSAQVIVEKVPTNQVTQKAMPPSSKSE